MSILSVRNLSKNYTIGSGLTRRSKDVVHAVEEVSLEIREGETLGIVGESGSGKTLLVRSLIGLLPPSITITGGTIRYQDHLLSKMNEHQLLLRLQLRLPRHHRPFLWKRWRLRLLNNLKMTSRKNYCGR